MKLCNKCKKEKPLDLFHKNKSKKDGLQDCCKPCCTIRDVEHRQKHKEKWNAHYKQKGREQQQWFKEIKKQYSCKKCGDKRWYVLDFHHIDPSQKEMNVSTAMVYSRQRVLDEISKVSMV